MGIFVKTNYYIWCTCYIGTYVVFFAYVYDLRNFLWYAYLTSIKIKPTKITKHIPASSMWNRFVLEFDNRTMVDGGGSYRWRQRCSIDTLSE
jgi:hypothetical protein